LGWAIFEATHALARHGSPVSSHTPLVARTLLLDHEVVKLWCPRRQQIFAAEALAPSTAMANGPDTFLNRDVIWFIDNEGACSTLIRGACSPEDITCIAECTMMLTVKFCMRIWYECIDTSANPSDGLSRDGLDCPLLGRWASEGCQPEWQFLKDHLDRLKFISSQGYDELCVP